MIRQVECAGVDTGLPTMEKITALPVYKQILQDSFGGVMYNVANRNQYDTSELLSLWNALSPAEREAAGGIAKGAINFITEVN
jgi:hypothetical protein